MKAQVKLIIGIAIAALAIIIIYGSVQQPHVSTTSTMGTTSTSSTVITTTAVSVTPYLTEAQASAILGSGGTYGLDTYDNQTSVISALGNSYKNASEVWIVSYGTGRGMQLTETVAKTSTPQTMYSGLLDAEGTNVTQSSLDGMQYAYFIYNGTKTAPFILFFGFKDAYFATVYVTGFASTSEPSVTVLASSIVSDTP